MEYPFEAEHRKKNIFPNTIQCTLFRFDIPVIVFSLYMALEQCYSVLSVENAHRKE